MSDIDWSRLAEEITRLYVTEGKSAEETTQILRDQHRVRVTIRQFKSRYSGLKKLRASEWRAVGRVVQKRKADGKLSDVFLGDRQIDPNRLARGMRRYCGARCQDPTGDEAVVDLGIDTVGRHRLEIRTPISQLTQCPNKRPQLAGIAVGNATISVEDPVEDSINEHIHDPTGWMFPFGLENADLSTPHMGNAKVSTCIGSLNDFERMPNDTEPQQVTSSSLQGEEYTLVEARQYQMAFHNPRRSPEVNASAFDLSYACLPPKPGQTIWSSNLSLSSFFLLPDVCEIVNSLEASGFLCGNNMARLEQLVASCSAISHPRINTSLQLAGMHSTSAIPQLVSRLANGILYRNDSGRLSDEVTALTSLIKSDQRVLHLIFSTVIHRCCNNTMLPDEFSSFCKWIVFEKIKDHLSAYLQKCPAISNAFAEAILRLVSSYRRINLIPDEDRAGDYLVQIIKLYKDESVHISKKVCGLLLHAVIVYIKSIDVLELLITRGAELNTVAAIHGNHKELQNHNDTPLIQALCRGAYSVVEFLLELGPEKGFKLDRDDICNGLSVALKIGNLQAAELLLSNGAEMLPHTIVDTRKLDDRLFDQQRNPKYNRYPMLYQLLNRHRTLLDRAVDAAASGSQALSKILLGQNIVQEKSLEIVLCQAIKFNNALALAIDHHADNSIVHLLIKAGSCVDEAILSGLSYHFKNWKSDGTLILSLMRRYQSDVFGASALQLATEMSNLAGCDLLLDLGASINLHGARGKNALQTASFGGNLLLVKFLLDQGADANVAAHDDGGRTALQAAVEDGYAHVAKCLLEAKADIRASPAKKKGMTVLEAFAWDKLARSRRGLVKGVMVSELRDWLSQGAPINRRDGDHGNVLHLLIRNRFHSATECLDIALQAGARIEDRDQFSRGQKTPLQVAAEVGNLDHVRLLLKYGADINAPPGDEFGRTAPQAAPCGQNPANIPAMIELLLSAGANVNAPPAKKGGITALQGAAISGDISIAQVFLDHGADVNAAPAAEEGRTAIEGAAEHGRLDMVRFLLSKGAAGDPERGFGRAIELAESENRFIIADLLREQQELSAGFDVGMDDMFGGDFFSQVPLQGFVFSDEGLENFPWQ